MSVISLCGNIDVNTGQIACDQRKGNPAQIVLGGASFSASDYASTATYDAAFLAKTKKARLSTDKLYPFPVVQGVADKTEAAKEGSLGYGLKFKLLRSKPGYEFDVISGTALDKQLQKFDGQIVPVFIIDSNNIVWGSVNKAGTQTGINCLVTVEAHGFGDAQNVKTTKVSISFIDAKDGVENLFGVTTTLGATDLVGLKDVQFSEKSAHATNVYKVIGVVPSAVAGRVVNIASVFGATLASASLWVAKVVASGVTHTITSVALNSAGDGYDITLDTTQYSALAAGAQISINLAAPSVLDAAGVTEIEGVTLIVTK